VALPQILMTPKIPFGLLCQVGQSQDSLHHWQWIIGIHRSGQIIIIHWSEIRIFLRLYWDNFPNPNHHSRLRSQWGRYNYPDGSWIFWPSNPRILRMPRIPAQLLLQMNWTRASSRSRTLASCREHRANSEYTERGGNYASFEYRAAFWGERDIAYQSWAWSVSLCGFLSNYSPSTSVYHGEIPARSPRKNMDWVWTCSETPSTA